MTITDAGGCTKSGSATVAGAAAISMTVAATPTTATVTSGGGTGAHSYNRTGATTFQPNPIFTDLNPGATYIFKTQDANGCQKSVIKKLPTSMTPAGGGAAGQVFDLSENQNFEKKQVAIFPNPTSEILNLAFANDDDPVAGRFEIFNSIGQRLVSNEMTVEPGEQGILQVGHLPQGTYFLKIRTTDGDGRETVSSERFVKSN